MEQLRLLIFAIVAAAVCGRGLALSAREIEMKDLKNEISNLTEVTSQQREMISDLQMTINDLVEDKSERKKRSAASGDNSGSVYTRWGRTSCPARSTLIYEGFAAGTNYNTGGGGSNYQCMPLDPEYNRYASGGYHSTISGAEYKSYSLGVFPNSAAHKNVPCARCHTYGSALMIPAKRSCPRGWNKEYEGYLMAARTASNRYPTTYECVDASPEYIIGNSDNSNGALFYFVKPDCSGHGRIAHCPPYVPDRQLTCVVCS